MPFNVCSLSGNGETAGLQAITTDATTQDKLKVLMNDRMLRSVADFIRCCMIHLPYNLRLPYTTCLKKRDPRGSLVCLFIAGQLRRLLGAVKRVHCAAHTCEVRHFL